MNESQKIIRALKAIEDIPFPQTGNGAVSVSIKGMYQYQDDMRLAKPYIANIRFSITYKEPINEKDVLALEQIANRVSIKQ
jgi:hypothetical protein